MKISMIGTGYVGLVTGTLFSDRGNKVICVDNNPKIVEKLNDGKIHIFEPGLEQLVEKNIKNQNLEFTEDIKYAVNNSDVVFLAVGTPSNKDGSFNLKYLESAAKDVGQALNNSEGYKVVVCKSTVPQGTSKRLIEVINNQINNKNLRWDYVSNPETLAEGNAVKDFAKPDRIIIGAESEDAFKIMEELYHPFNIKKNKIKKGTPADAELAKLFSNTALATRIAMINEMARVADVTPEADMDMIRRMVCEDNRIGYSFMFPSPGYGGSCFPKDIQGLVHQSNVNGYNPMLLSQIHNSNEAHKEYIGDRIAKILSQEKPKIAVWGVTFKPNTDDMRDAASIPIITRLINEDAEVIAYDPKDEKAKEIFGDKVKFVDEKYEAVNEADALILLTEWREFDAPNFSHLKEIMKGKDIFDMRNRWLPQAVNRNGFNYYGVGRKYLLR